MAFINKISSFILGAVPIATPTGVWEKIIMWFNTGITNYGWAIIVFTVALKVIMSPLDFFNKKVTEKNAKVQALIQPEIAKIQKQYGNNKQVVNQKTMEVYKKYNYNVTGSCLIMMLNLGLTLFIFITLFAGLNSMAAYKVGYQYQEMEKVYSEQVIATDYDDYLAAYNAQIATYITGEETIADVTETEKAEAKLFAEGVVAGKTETEMLTTINTAVLAKYNQVKESWLWVSNVWKSDTPWTKSVDTFDEFVKMAGITYKDSLGENEVETFKVRLSANKAADTTIYNNVMSAVASENKENGYLIIPILAVAATVLSMLASQGKLKFKRKKSGEAEVPASPMPKSGGILMAVLLSGLMGYITITYNSVFALYILVGSLFGLATQPLMSFGIKKLNQYQEKRKVAKTTGKVSYSREAIANNQKIGQKEIDKKEIPKKSKK
jgi:YidC/Oxa1 family membrane protein insertase